MKKKFICAIILLTSLCMGCGSANSSYYDKTASFTPASINDSAIYEESSYEYAESESYSESTDFYLNSDRKLIKTIDLDIETENFDELVGNVSKEIESLGGYAEQFNQYGRDSYRSCYITARIPKANLSFFITSIDGQSNIVSKNERVEDVTLTYVDLESHKRALTTEQNRLLELMQMAETVDDIITIEDRLSNIRYQIDSMESQLRSYDNKVDFATVYLNISEVTRYTPIEKQTIWQRISVGFVDNIYDMGEAIGNIFVWFVVYLPNLIICGIIITLIVLFVRKKKNKKKNIEKKDE